MVLKSAPGGQNGANKAVLSAYFSEDDFLEKKYNDAKALLAAWKDHTRMGIIGKAMLANAMYFSRFRYYAQCMSVRSLTEAIVSDAQALVWNKGEAAEFDANEKGTALVSRRFMKERSQYGDRKRDLGLGMRSPVLETIYSTLTIKVV